MKNPKNKIRNNLLIFNNYTKKNKNCSIKKK